MRTFLTAFLATLAALVLVLMFGCQSATVKPTTPAPTAASVFSEASTQAVPVRRRAPSILSLSGRLETAPAPAGVQGITLSAPVQTSNGWALHYVGELGRHYQIEASNSLTNWRVLTPPLPCVPNDMSAALGASHRVCTVEILDPAGRLQSTFWRVRQVDPAPVAALNPFAGITINTN